MGQDNIEALVKLIMSDKRFMDFLKNGMNENHDLVLHDLVMVENKEIYDNLPMEWRGNVYCQEFNNGGDNFLSCDEITKKEWKSQKIFNPSLNFIAKLTLGIADEPILKIFQGKLIEGADNLELIHLDNVSRIKVDSYKKIFQGYLEKIKAFGIRINDGGISSAVDDARICSSASGANIWQKKALTEIDVLNMENGTTVTVGKKCIVTSLAFDMVRRKSIQICREGEIK